MIKIENTRTIGWEEAIRGMRNPMNSWRNSDSIITHDNIYVMGKKDYDLMKHLRNSGTDHRKFMRMIIVYADIIAPLYWWKEFDTYKVGTVANSCSTMHKIAAKEFTLDDFSHEHLIKPVEKTEVVPGVAVYEKDYSAPFSLLNCTIDILNNYREEYLKTKDKKYWWQLIQLLPSSYNQKRTVMMNYEVLANIYKSRKNHKLDEWRTLCTEWISSLPCCELIEGGEP